MKTPQNDMQYFTAFYIIVLFSGFYNKIERIVKFNRTHLMIQKRFDFLYSVDWQFFLPQL